MKTQEISNLQSTKPTKGTHTLTHTPHHQQQQTIQTTTSTTTINNKVTEINKHWSLISFYLKGLNFPIKRQGQIG